MKLPVPVRVAVALLLLVASSAHAQLFRAYLSPTGSDSNPCTLQAPCRLLPAALAAVADFGEIWLTGSANYNTATVNIGKSVTIIAVPGAVGSVIAIGGPAIRIDTPGANVALRNVVVAQLPGGGGTNGVEVAVAGVFVQLDRSLIANLPGSGIVVSSGNLHVVDSVVRDNGGWGIDVGDGGSVSVATSKLVGNGSGGLRTNRAQAPPVRVPWSTTRSSVAAPTVHGHRRLAADSHASHSSAAPWTAPPQPWESSPRAAVSPG